ncbi:cytochrome P450 81Q32-like [Mercurialis annua]|uniref:cytochrome P450 81Q32-like n=1 Tax=Mercurialis annua TaxID=3986 RepID=UPI00215E8CE7|nr:cytochrome P450 81Q32-like [Mercurialis annua]
MEAINLYFLYTFLSILFLFFAYQFYPSKNNKGIKLPPSPPYALPILGHLHLLKPLLHRAFYGLSQKYGPIISLKLGSRLVVIVSSPSAVEECYTKNDIVLANRPQYIMSKYFNYNNNNLISAPYGHQWRNLRRIAATEIFSANRLNAFLSSRNDEIKQLLYGLCRAGGREFAQVELKPMFKNATFNILMQMVAGKKYYGDDVNNEEQATKFKEIIEEIFSFAGVSNLEDVLPFLRWINGGKLEKKLEILSNKMDLFLEDLLEEHRSKEKGLESKAATMIDRLLSLQESEPNNYKDEVIKGLIMVMLLGGTDTPTLTLEWAMASLVNNPNVLQKAKTEIDLQVGQKRLLEESDLPNLPYLQSIISETLRLYPAGPLLVPHYSSKDCIINGYNIPINTIVLINAWAIHRDPTVWDDPSSFRPERFEADHRLGVHQTYNYIPFGGGRRVCPGMGLAQRILGLTIGSLIQCFEWKRMDEKLVDMSEDKGFAMPKAEPLKVMCKACAIMNEVLAQAS